MNDVQENKAEVIPFMQEGSFFYKKGIEAYQNKKVDRSLHYIKKAIQMEPEEPVFLCQMAIVLSEEGDYEASNQWLNKIKNDVDPYMSECYFFLANNQAHTGEFQEAKENVETYLEMDPSGDFQEDAESLLLLLESELGSTDKRKESDDPFYSKAVLLLHENKLEEAEEETRKLIAVEPEAWDYYALLGETLWKQGKQKEGGRILQDLLLKENPPLAAYCQYAVFLAATNSDQAAAWADMLKQIHPLNTWERYLTGRALYTAGEYEASYQLLKDAVPPDHPVYVHQLAVTASRSGRFERAAQLWNHLVRLQPEYREKALELAARAEKSLVPEEQDKDWMLKR
ncbi:tetratricopeptide repeat protein [Alkalicoccus saliphilus]|uniref:Tetratricopeptide repeat protein n=1 Tax=Alkalicoccus saliphilus TaxID=200989 RepID=A0A2T4U650_9BACI|nr:tetratricopeptide repeat protein [Alkalicoccus saliphilus]PTL38862.1 hypothetical protein C6Y45_08705 [Alkalicoccus saliphilus]